MPSSSRATSTIVCSSAALAISMSDSTSVSLLGARRCALAATVTRRHRRVVVRLGRHHDGRGRPAAAYDAPIVGASRVTGSQCTRPGGYASRWPPRSERGRSALDRLERAGRSHGRPHRPQVSSVLPRRGRAPRRPPSGRASGRLRFAPGSGALPGRRRGRHHVTGTAAAPGSGRRRDRPSPASVARRAPSPSVLAVDGARPAAVPAPHRRACARSAPCLGARRDARGAVLAARRATSATTRPTLAFLLLAYRDRPDLRATLGTQASLDWEILRPGS